MVEKPAEGHEEEVKVGDDYETVKKNMNNEQWCIDNWMTLGSSGQQWALSIHGEQLWNKILGG